MIGGALARPCISYPELFPRGTIWDRYPYLLPNLFSAATVFVGVVIGYLFLEETHTVKKQQRDRGREIGDRITALFRRAHVCQGRNPEKESLLANDRARGYNTSAAPQSPQTESLPAYRSQENSPRLSPQADPETSSLIQGTNSEASQKLKIFTKPVIMNIISYGILAL